MGYIIIIILIFYLNGSPEISMHLSSFLHLHNMLLISTICYEGNVVNETGWGVNGV